MGAAVAYSDNFDRELIMDGLDEESTIALKIVMKEGELRFRDALIKSLERDITEYLDEVDGMPNVDWINGMRYAIHIIREADLDGQRG